MVQFTTFLGARFEDHAVIADPRMISIRACAWLTASLVKLVQSKICDFWTFLWMTSLTNGLVLAMSNLVFFADLGILFFSLI